MDGLRVDDRPTMMQLRSLRIREERPRRGWSLTRVSGLTGIAASDLSALERGRRYPHPGWRRRLALAYRMPEDALFAPGAELR